MKKMRRLEWLIVLGVATLGGLVGAHADMLTWNGGATNDFTAAASWTPAQKPQPGDFPNIHRSPPFRERTYQAANRKRRKMSPQMRMIEEIVPQKAGKCNPFCREHRHAHCNPRDRKLRASKMITANRNLPYQREALLAPPLGVSEAQSRE